MAKAEPFAIEVEYKLRNVVSDKWAGIESHDCF